ncbi:Short-chain dehydrogenase [Caulobacter sp. UNC279MFTsu5.1]|nr:Short-chain dehydrogenase [Caulobacter sp. UNC279MFTsu5.1]
MAAAVTPMPAVVGAASRGLSNQNMTKPRTYLITGAASGIGAAIATKLAHARQNVMLADINAEGATALAQTLGERASAVALDIRDPAAWERAFDATIARFGSFDVLINNAGLVRTGLAKNVAIADHQLTMDTNVMGPVTGMVGAFKRFQKQGAGHLVTVCSMTSFMPFPGVAIYGASKHALRAFHHGMAIEERHSGIDFTIVHPTATETPMLELEAADPDAVMCFVAPSVSADTVADTVVKAIKRKAIEVCMPQAGSGRVKALGVDPKKLRAYADQLEAMGKDGLAKWQASAA